MFEPLLEVTIPDTFGTISQSYQAGDAANTEKLIIVQQVYGNVVAQKNVYNLCKFLTDDAGIRLITVEGADKQLAPDPLQPSLEQLMKVSSDVSTGVLSLLNTHPASLTVWGVDLPDLIARSSSIMMYLGTISRERERVFNVIRQILRKARQKSYPLPLARFRNKTVLINMNQEISIMQQVALLKEVAALVHQDIQDFPALTRIDTLMKMAKQINVKRAKKQMQRFILRIIARLTGWYEIAQGKVIFDLSKAMPLLQFWVDETGQTEDELKQNLELLGMQEMCFRCKEWIETKLANDALQLRLASDFEQAPHFEGLMRIALLLDIPYFDLSDFRYYVAHHRIQGELWRNRFQTVNSEVTVCSQLLVDKLASKKVSELFEIEEQLAAIYRHTKLEVSAHEAEMTTIKSGQLHQLLEDLCKIAEMPFPNVVERELAVIDDAIDQARSFTQFSKRRGQHMIEVTLALIRQRGEDRAILVIGGFHSQAISRILEDLPQISWSILTPTVDLSQFKGVLGQ